MNEAFDRQSAFSGVKDVAAHLAFDASALERHLIQHVPGFSGPITRSLPAAIRRPPPG